MHFKTLTLALGLLTLATAANAQVKSMTVRAEGVLCLSCAHDFNDAFVLADVPRIEPQLIDTGFERQQRELVMKVDVSNQRDFRHAFADRAKLGGCILAKLALAGEKLVQLSDQLIELRNCARDLPGPHRSPNCKRAVA